MEVQEKEEREREREREVVGPREAKKMDEGKKNKKAKI